MQKDTNRDGFNIGAHTMPSAILNYVWISKVPSADDDASKISHVPLHRFSRAFKNAKNNPQADVNIWLDFSLMNDATRFFVISQAYLLAPKNVTLRDLQDIPAYRNEPMFEEAVPENIWARADFARLLVLKHVFSTTHKDHVLYSDLDAKNLQVNAPKLILALARYGIAFANAEGELENGFIGLNRTMGLDFLNKHLLPMTRNHAREGTNGYRAMISAVNEWKRVYGFHEMFVNDIAAVRLDQRLTYHGRSKYYRDLGLY